VILLAGIDGTGTSDDPEYNTEFASSHVRSLTRLWTWQRHGPAFYQRGPGNFGSDTEKRAQFAADFLVSYLTMRKAMKQKTGIFLVGYSRGAAAALHACRLLHRKNIGVDCLLMFDAVDRTHTMDADLTSKRARLLSRDTEPDDSVARLVRELRATT
jgi:thioesterase domain-containing protein